MSVLELSRRSYTLTYRDTRDDLTLPPGHER